MTIRRKTLGVICLTLLLMGTTVYIVGYRVLIDGYARIEETEIVRATEQTCGQMKEDLNALASVAGDWAPWDDTYNFMADLNSQYVASNLSDATLVNLGVNFLVYLDTRNQVRHCQYVDLQEGRQADCPAGIRRVVAAHAGVFQGGQFAGNVSGYTILDGQVLLMAASSILTSKLEGPSRGTLVVGKYLNPAAVTHLEEKLKLPVQMEQVDGNDTPERHSGKGGIDASGNRYWVHKLNDETMASVIEFKGISDTPLFTLRILKKRDVFQQAKKSTDSLLWGLVVISLAFSAAMMLFIEKTVLSRLSGLSRAVRGIAETETRENRIAETGPDEIGSLSQDINQMLDKIWESRQWYKALFESASDAILLLKDYRVVDCNEMASTLFLRERPEMLGKKIFDLSPRRQPDGTLSKEMFQTALEGAQSGGPYFVEWVFRKKDGAEFETEMNLTSIDIHSGRYFQAIIRDVTERKKSRRLMIETEKMMSLGGLAAGMAHEINNPLTGMLLNAQVMEDRFYENLPANSDAAEKAGTSLPAVRRYLEDRGIPRQIANILESGRQAAAIVDSMLGFARKDNSVKAAVNVTDIVEKALALYRRTRAPRGGAEEVSLVREYPDEAVIVLGSASSLQQVFFNVLRNAAEALGEQENNKHPEIRIRIDTSGTAACIEIGDNGPGMTEAVRRRVFEPFFTTKGPGRGTGLGLFVSYFIVCDDHGGEMTVKTLAGEGTRFIIRLPLLSSLPQSSDPGSQG